ncbi:hypothetical protein UCREL1_8595 [Eutypa lata UCREL1]|uniref:2EXR domain-containing protein n=1 Tax=Eutypa lata (strain UCR-EL1) TaxID=1287681 RepID=M7SJQ3_EUTLA|nr:hypothetical protein UCREL1_8595 [Eutypa lata UCREL1]
MQGPIELGEAGAVQQMDSARRFPQFSLLPVELRMKIWKDAIETPRIIHIGSRDKVDTSTCVVFNDNLCVQVVEMFLVNAESRAAAFEYPFIHFSVLPDPDDSDEFHFLVTPNDIVSMGAHYHDLIRFNPDPSLAKLFAQLFSLISGSPMAKKSTKRIDFKWLDKNMDIAKALSHLRFVQPRL